VRWLADENFHYAIVRGLRRRNPAFDIIRTQDAGLVGSEDPVLLAWAAEQGRMILTHDIPHHACLA
jgi:predicted nuclease of predicted toxin-antitoxin system